MFDRLELHRFILVTWSFATVFGQRVTWHSPSLGEMFYLKCDEGNNILKRIDTFLHMLEGSKHVHFEKHVPKVSTKKFLGDALTPH